MGTIDQQQRIALTAAAPALAAAPFAFVLLWSTGFIVARLVVPHAEPMTFLVLRFGLVVVLLGALVVRPGGQWADRRVVVRQMLIGVFLHGLYLDAIFWAVADGLPAGFAGLLAGLQPVMTGLLARPLLGEAVGLRRSAGIALGFAGAILVLAPKLGQGSGLVEPHVVLVALGGVLSITLGTMLQKRIGGGVDLRVAGFWQYVGALVPTLPAAAVVGAWRFDATPEVLIGLAWACLVLSVGAIALLYRLLRHGAVAGVASLLYLVPATTALMAFVLFGEALSAVQFLGFAVTAVGVAIAARG